MSQLAVLLALLQLGAQQQAVSLLAVLLALQAVLAVLLALLQAVPLRADGSCP